MPANVEIGKIAGGATTAISITPRGMPANAIIGRVIGDASIVIEIIPRGMPVSAITDKIIGSAMAAIGTLQLAMLARNAARNDYHDHFNQNYHQQLAYLPIIAHIVSQNSLIMLNRSPKKSPSKSAKINSLAKNNSLTASPASQRSTKALSVHIQKGPNDKTKIERQKLANTLDTYTLLIRSRNPIRCLEHNSNISIYCETEQRLLCANCIFGRTQHKYHRVTPIDRSYEKIEKDIETMDRLVNRQIESMQKTHLRLMQNLSQEEEDAHLALTTLVQHYEDAHRNLQENFTTSKMKILERLQKIRIGHEKILLQLKLHLQNYSTHGLLKPISKQHFQRQEVLLYEHAVCTAIVSQRKFEENNWAMEKKQIAKVSGEELKKIQAVLEVIGRVSSK